MAAEMTAEVDDWTRIEKLAEKLTEKDELIAILQKAWDSSSRRVDDVWEVVRAERLLREAIARERDRSARELTLRGPGIRKELRQMLKIKENVRRFFYHCFPEFDLEEGGARCWPGHLVSQTNLMSDTLHRLSTAVHSLVRHESRVSVVVLPPESFKGPGFLSQTVWVTPGQEVQVPFDVPWPMEGGGWVISHGGTLSGVFVGNQAQSQGPDNTYCQLTDAIPLGYKLHVRVRATPGAA